MIESGVDNRRGGEGGGGGREELLFWALYNTMMSQQRDKISDAASQHYEESLGGVPMRTTTFVLLIMTGKIRRELAMYLRACRHMGRGS